jgi:COP9 signalosome complex subunit 4
LNAVLSESVPLVVSRTLITQMIEFMRQGVSSEMESQKRLCEYIIEKIQPRAVSYEESLMVVCEYLSRLYQEHKAWSDAADTLARIDLESGMRVVDSGYKLGNCIKISRLYLEDGNIKSADAFLKKASSLLASAAGQGSLLLQYQECSAMILDKKGKFTEASTKYYDLSTQLQDGVDVDEEVHLSKLDALECAIRCAIVAVAGPQRSKLLSTLHKDEECAKSPLFEILDKVYLQQLVLPREVKRFSTLLSKHRHARIDSQHILNVLDTAIIQHNLVACSKLYINISFLSLARLLHITQDRAQDIVATMIREGRLPAEIDQIDDLVIFHHHQDQTGEVDPVKNASSGMNQVEEALLLADRALTLAKGLDNHP